MKRLAIAAALAVAIGLGYAETASAQYIYRYNTITPRGGVASTTQLYNLGAYQQYLNGELVDSELPQEQLDEAAGVLAGMPSAG